MSYDYQTERPNLFTESGSGILIEVRDKAHELLKQSGAFIAGKVLTGDSWVALAALDYLVEKGELVEVPNPTSSWAQFRIFTERPE